MEATTDIAAAIDKAQKIAQKSTEIIGAGGLHDFKEALLTHLAQHVQRTLSHMGGGKETSTIREFSRCVILSYLRRWRHRGKV